ncbi:LOW QUALITY PROTEIN: uncharacterized protein LOC110025512 [Phalaenopsis equestris]|uniref:LOW QUALITY PROTEIN: uncharacterized protein LOC110025512 n=1 Tax=Phalaenopsis equestris TaxID=78828 RepID=UPI0009E36864|nr:LOW QUALITY PROTEIN: uncharacterized protein LOC110025512 [Phalaenopsis equestris]
MALTSFLSSADAGGQDHHHHRKPKKKHPPPPSPLTLSWDHLRTLLNCKTNTGSTQVHDPASSSAAAAPPSFSTGKHLKLRLPFVPSICALGDVVHGSIRVVHRSDIDQSNSSGGESGPLSRSSAAGELDSPGGPRRQPPAASAAAKGGSQLMRLSGCYECRAVDAEPVSRRYPRPRTLCACPQCGEVFNKTDSLELHQAIRHAVSELGPEDSGRHIVEIIFKSSWQKNHRTICKIDRILKVHNTPRTISRFEDYRAAHSPPLPAAASRRNPRCAADGNELLRFYSVSISCHLGAAGSTSLCFAGGGAAVCCGVCDVIQHGFRQPYHPFGVRTTASSGQAHEDFVGGGERAMLVCRVIAGRVWYAGDGDEVGDLDGYDSVAAEGANLEELFVANPRAILPCFVVIYRFRD